NQFITDTERLFSGFICKKSQGDIFHIVVTADSVFNLYESSADIWDNIFYFSDIDIAQAVAARPVLVCICAVDLNDIPVFQKKGPYLSFRFFNQYLSFHFPSSFPFPVSPAESCMMYRNRWFIMQFLSREIPV